MRRILKLILIAIFLFSAGKVMAHEQTGSITVHLKSGEGNICVYCTDTFAETDPQILYRLIQTKKLPGITKPALPDQPTVFRDLPLGSYLVTHEDNAFLPFLVSIPITVDNTTSLSVEAYPKAQNPQTPQTGDTVKPFILLLPLVLSLVGILALICVKKTEMASSRGRMFLERIQNKQKRLP